jgi:hypothetical protein
MINKHFVLAEIHTSIAEITFTVAINLDISRHPLEGPTTDGLDHDI